MALGLFSWVADRLLDTLLGTPLFVIVNFGNAAAPWVAVAFAAGTTSPTLRRGALLGCITVLVAVGVYYLTLALPIAGPEEVRPGVVTLWLAVALATGPVFGAAGGAWRSGRGRLPALAVGLLGAALLGEAAHVFLQLGGFGGVDLRIGRMQMVLLLTAAALALPFLLLRGRERLMAYAVAAAVAIVGLLAMAIVTATLGELVRT